MPEFLSEAWFEAFAAALKGLPVSAVAADAAVAADTATGGLALGQIITGVPEEAGAAGVQAGELRYTVVLRQDGSASLVRDSTEPADVILVEDWSTAEAIVSGRSSLPDLLTAGKIKLRGDSRALVSAGDILTRVAPLLAAALANARTS
ncbi:MAG: hypothetical protein ACLQCU_12295 [Acidimicrobiales bacterium]